MKTKLNKLIETIANQPSEKLEGPILVITSLLLLFSIWTILYCLQLPVPDQTEEGIRTQSLGKLLWKFRTNR